MIKRAQLLRTVKACLRPCEGRLTCLLVPPPFCRLHCPNFHVTNLLSAICPYRSVRCILPCSFPTPVPRMVMQLRYDQYFCYHGLVTQQIPPKFSELRRQQHSCLSTKMQCGESSTWTGLLWPMQYQRRQLRQGLESYVRELMPAVSWDLNFVAHNTYMGEAHIASPRGLGFLAVQWGVSKVGALRQRPRQKHSRSLWLSLRSPGASLPWHFLH